MNRVWPILLLALPCYSQMTQTPAPPVAGTSIRPFHVQIPQAQIEDLRRRLAGTRWPDKPQLFSEELRAAFRPYRSPQ
jgi:epoxide hydrolase-like protein